MPFCVQRCLRGFGLALISVACWTASPAIAVQGSPPGEKQNAQALRVAGTVNSIEAQAITIRSDSNSEMKVRIGSTSRILRVAPGQKDLTNATAISLQDIQPGDRVLVRGQASGKDNLVMALAVIVMKQADIAARREHDREDWQKRGIGGLVDSVDSENATVTITSGGFGTTKKVLIRATKETALRRYAPDSVKFDDAKPAPLDQIKPGDQLRARGTRGADVGELTADEIVSGSFRNIAGTITAIDNATDTITVKDAIAKNNAVKVKLTSDSHMKKMPPEMAQQIAMRLKAASGQGGPSQTSPEASGSSAGAASNADAQSNRGTGEATPSQRSGGAPDFDHLLMRLPNSTLADLQKGDAVIVVATSGEGDEVTAITLLAGVEPILTASPNRNASAMMFSAWTLGGGGADAEGP